MRVTSEIMVTRSLDRLQNRLKAYERSQSELAAGKRILTPSDDPSGTRRAMSLTAAMRAREQELANASDARGWLDAADSELQSAMDRMSRLRELALRGASNASQTEREALAAEITQIGEEIAGIANTRHLDRPLFGGYTDGRAVAQDAGGVWSAFGSGDIVTRRVSDTEQIRVNITAQEWLGFQADGSTNGSDTLTVIAEVVAGLRAGEQVTGDQLDALRVGSDRIAAALGDIGAASNRVASARERAESMHLTLRMELSEVQDLDLAKGVMELQVQQVAYEATLQALAKALPPSLAAFLR